MKTVFLLLALLPAGALHADVLFSDLGPPGDVYNPIDAWAIYGSTSGGVFSGNASVASLFPLGGSGPQSVGEIDLAVTNELGVDTFYASIWTDSGGVPGTQVPSAYWSLTAPTQIGPNPPCCGLVSVTGISGVTLTGGAQYFLILGPLSLTDNSFNVLSFNNQGVSDPVLSSVNGGITWANFDPNNGDSPLGAFDIIGSPAAVPEPMTLPLLGGVLISIAALRRRFARSANHSALNPE